jgi:ubiquinone biosynthesis monooxygenase Coq7
MALDPHTRLSAREALTIARILRVNHAGEYGAIRIYGAQISIAKRWYPDVVPALADMLGHEKQHCAAFFAAMPARDSRPCRVMSLWSLGG